MKKLGFSEVLSAPHLLSGDEIYTQVVLLQNKRPLHYPELPPSTQAKLGLHGSKWPEGAQRERGPAGAHLPSPRGSELGLHEGQGVIHHHTPLAGCLVTREVGW